MLTGHEGPVWQVAWAHPQYASVLASCSFDGSVIVWKEGDGGKYVRVRDFKGHDGSINSIAWAPYEFGLILACGSSDGKVSVFRCKPEEGGKWEQQQFLAHSGGCNSVSWCPRASSSSLLSASDDNPLQLVSGGCDNLIRVWKWDDQSGQFKQEGPALEGHSDWVRDVAWSPVNHQLIASCSQDRSVLIWRLDSNGSWAYAPLSKEQFADALWRVSWSVAGSVLAVAGGEGKVTLWREGLDDWEMISTVDQSAL